jgi:hypothetical protein
VFGFTTMFPTKDNKQTRQLLRNTFWNCRYTILTSCFLLNLFMNIESFFVKKIRTWQRNIFVLFLVIHESFLSILNKSFRTAHRTDSLIHGIHVTKTYIEPSFYFKHNIQNLYYKDTLFWEILAVLFENHK